MLSKASHIVSPFTPSSLIFETKKSTLLLKLTNPFADVQIWRIQHFLEINIKTYQLLNSLARTLKDAKSLTFHRFE